MMLYCRDYKRFIAMVCILCVSLVLIYHLSISLKIYEKINYFKDKTEVYAFDYNNNTRNAVKGIDTNKGLKDNNGVDIDNEEVGDNYYSDDDGYKAHTYKGRVDLRVIVMTFDRPDSLKILLESLDELEMDGDEASIEIWIDRRQSDAVVNEKTLIVSKEFARTSKIKCLVHVHDNHVGLYGQWILTYNPTNENIRIGREKVLFMEDDQQVSRFAYRWLKAVHENYEKDEDYLGCTLATFETHALRESIPKNHSVFQHRVFSTHSFIPKLSVWKEFQRWLKKHLNRQGFKPYVPNIISTKWYKSFEKINTTSSMWSMWMIYFTYAEQLFTVFPNAQVMIKNKTSFCLNADRRQPGLHFGKSIKYTPCKRLNFWRNELIQFPADIYKINWDGKRLNQTPQIFQKL